MSLSKACRRPRELRRLDWAARTWFVVALGLFVACAFAASVTSILFDSAMQIQMPKLCHTAIEDWTPRQIQRCAHLVGPAWSQQAFALTTAAVAAALFAACGTAIAQGVRTRADVAVREAEVAYREATNN